MSDSDPMLGMDLPEAAPPARTRRGARAALTPITVVAATPTTGGVAWMHRPDPDDQDRAYFSLFDAGGVAALAVSSQRIYVYVPDLVGLRHSVAECRLAGAGLRWTSNFDTSVRTTPLFGCPASVLPDPVVLRQDPVAGTPLTPRTVIVLITPCSAQRPCQ